MSVLPGDTYEPPPVVRQAEGGLVVEFIGDDGRRKCFDIGRLPVAGWHEFLAEAFALRTGPSGGLRTLASALNCWKFIRQWTYFLQGLGEAAASPEKLSEEHVQAFFDGTAGTATFRYQLRAEVRTLFSDPRLAAWLPEAARSALSRTIPKPPGTPVGGYSTEEWDRLTAAARADTARIARRVRAAEELLLRFRTEPGKLSADERVHAEVLNAMAATGVVPALSGGPKDAERCKLASQLFLTWQDLAPILVLLAIVTARNGETLKELTAKHRVLDGRAVELEVTKRRRGPKRWFQTVTWEIGPPNRELHTAGGVYLLLLELTARSREICGSTSAVCFWRNGHRSGIGVTKEEHWAPFEQSLRLATSIMPLWAKNRRPPLRADADEDGSTPPPLQVTFNRIKTTADAQRTKHLGGHLPSAAKTNTAQVLFTNYLAADETTREWAEEVMAEALVDAEQAAIAAHQAALQSTGRAPTVIPGPASPKDFGRAGLDEAAATNLASGDLDTAWTACADHDRHPATGTPCGDSFLDCFHCGNCLVTRDHLPRLVALTDALLERRQQMNDLAWWQRYGPAWVAVKRDILAKFDPAEIADARAQHPHDALLDLVEPPWEQP
nr:hypothetical protein OG409_18275 [Streptomyces sp. NBC_00974]